jgi:hypothetical protein
LLEFGLELRELGDGSLHLSLHLGKLRVFICLDYRVDDIGCVPRLFEAGAHGQRESGRRALSLDQPVEFAGAKAALEKLSSSGEYIR